MGRVGRWCNVAAIGVLALVASFAAATHREAGHPARVLSPLVGRAVEELPPLHQLDFGGNAVIGSTVFAPDGRELYVQLLPEVISIWQVLVFLWPELLGALTVLVALVALLLAGRVVRRPQCRGSLHCRRCNYDLTGLATRRGPAQSSGPCPECGVDLARQTPRVGRRMRRRLAPVFTPLLVILLVCCAMWAVGVPRQGRASAWIVWPSEWAAKQAKQGQIAWLARFVATRERIIAVNPTSGLIIRTVASRTVPTYFPLSVSPDGNWLLLSGGPDTLERVSVRTGAVGGSVPLAGSDSYRRFGGRDIVGYTPDGGTAYVVHSDAERIRTRVVEWNLATDAVTAIFETDAYPDRRGRSDPHARRVVFVPGNDPLFAIAPSFQESLYTQSYPIWLFSPRAGQVVRELRVAESVSSYSSPVISPDGRRLFLSAVADGILGIDLESGESLGHVKPAKSSASGVEELLINRAGDLLFLPLGQGSIAVRSLPERRWATSLSTTGLEPPLLGRAPGLAISSDGRWLSVVGLKAGTPQGGPSAFELLIYDLSRLF
jgi:hypothetical protein